MAKKKPTDKKTDVKKDNIPEFKPGKTPHYEYDGVVLNENVAWDKVVLELQQAGECAASIAGYAECEASVITNILKKKYDGLTFRAGARMLAMHCRAYPNACSNL